MGNWLQHDRETRPKTSGLSRRRAEIGNHLLRENKASQMRKDYSS
jgi:hypothetical protein